MQLKAGAGCCEEAHSSSREFYIPCNRPATQVVKNRDGEYRMCEPCAHHNINNRGATLVGPYSGPLEEETASVGHNSGVTEPSDDDLSAYAEDAKLGVDEKGNILSKITNTVRELREAEEDIKSVEAMLKAAQERRRALVETTLPMLMDEAQQKRLTTLDGWEVTRSEVVRASIKAENLDDAVIWLTENGHGAIIKRDIRLQFGKGEEEAANKAVSLLTEKKYFPVDKLSVHPMTLGSLVTELLAEGKTVPMETLGVYVQPVVKLRPPSIIR